MRLKNLLFSVSILALLPVNAHAANLNTDNSDTLSPRAEVSVKGGTERSILTTEFWAPLAQQSGKVFYGDLRLMGDNDDNREGNLGLGYRQVSGITNSVLGGHIWIDRRHTDNNNTFHQITIGAESLGNVIDLRANGYIALNGSKTAITPNLGSVTPYLAGSGVFIDTNGRITETAQHGTDAEIGYRLPILQHYADAIRIYGGTYDFFGNRTENVFGYRTRISAQVNSAISVGARFQHDNIRGDQGFLEATLRFPFSAKKLYQQKGLYGRLDESPERDVDIVTEAKARSGMMTPFTNASGTAQRILYVDNSNASSIADGTKEHPYTTLQAAQTALQANDILYIASGNGTTAGMSNGITITQDNISVIGSGSALTVGGYTFINAGNAPTITNTTQASAEFDYLTGDAIVMTGGGDLFVTGVNTSNTGGGGVYIIADAGHTINSATITNVTGSNNKIYGTYIGAMNGGKITNATMSNITATGNGYEGARFDSLVAGSSIGTITASNINAYNNRYGMVVYSPGGTIDNLNISSANLSANRGSGILIDALSNGVINNINLSSFNTINNTNNGIDIDTDTSGRIGNATVSNLVATGNKYGIQFLSQNSGVINQASIISSTANSNSQSGINFVAQNNGRIDTVIATNVSANSNTQHGVYTLAQSNGIINTANISSVTTTNNAQNGVFTFAQTGGSIGYNAISNVLTENNNGTAGVYIFSSAVIGQVQVSNIVATNNAQLGVFASTGSGFTIGTVNFDNITATLNKSTSIMILSNGTINNATISNSVSSNNVNRGIILQASGIGTLTTSVISNNTSLNNGGIGILGYLSSGATANSWSFINNNVSGTANANDGINIQSTGASSKLNTLVVSGNTSNNNTGRGMNISANTSGQIGTMTIDNNTANNNTVVGAEIFADSGQVGTMTITNNTFNNNTSYGLRTNSNNAGATIGALNISGNITNANGSTGNYTTALNSGVISNLNITGNTANNNTGANGHGIRVDATGTSSANNAVISGNTANGNAQNGFMFYEANTANISVSFFNNNATTNGLHGLYAAKSGTGTYVLDAGGGGLSSIGGNRIFSNTGTEVQVDGGYTLSARTNYWGGGDLTVGEKTLNGGSTVDSTGFLTVDPRP